MLPTSQQPLLRGVSMPSRATHQPFASAVDSSQGIILYEVTGMV